MTRRAPSLRIPMFSRLAAWPRLGAVRIGAAALLATAGFVLIQDYYFIRDFPRGALDEARLGRGPDPGELSLWGFGFIAIVAALIVLPPGRPRLIAVAVFFAAFVAHLLVLKLYLGIDPTYSSVWTWTR